MALPVSASFTGTNGTAIRTLADWDGARTDGVSGGACVIQSNTAQAGAAQQIAADWWTSDAPSADQVARATVTAIAAGAYIGVGVRLSGTDNNGTFSGYLFYSDSADGSYIDKIVSGSWVASIAGPGAVFAPGDALELSISGTALTAKVNGVTRLTATDSAISSGSFGIAAYANGASAIDNFEGDNLGAATVYPVAAWFRRRPAMIIDSWRMAWAGFTQSTFQRLRSAPHRTFSSWLRRRTPPRASGSTV